MFIVRINAQPQTLKYQAKTQTLIVPPKVEHIASKKPIPNDTTKSTSNKPLKKKTPLRLRKPGATIIHRKL